MNADARHHSLDALRAGALLLGIALHAAMSFLPGFRAVGWPIVDDSQSTALAMLYFVVHVFRMTLFFLIAGFFARLILARLGTWGFIKHRLRRIGLPLLAAMLVVMPLTIVPLVVAVKWHGKTGGSAATLLRPQGGVAWGHLWFLYLLLVLYALGLALRCAVIFADRNGAMRRAVDRAFRFALTSRLAPMIFAAPLASVLYFTPGWQAWDGIPLPIIGFVPNFPAVLAFGLAMSVGWLLHRQQAGLELLARDSTVYLAVAALTSIWAFRLVGPDAQMRVVDMAPATRAIYASLYTLAIWAWTLGLVGLAVSFRRRESAHWRYLADASYWMYLTHIPVVWGLQVWMMKWPLPWQLKYPFILAITVAVLLLLYRYCVRGTFMGAFLNGRRFPVRSNGGLFRPVGPVPERYNPDDVR
jgi:peptidoglycan/LPS O-acetylase OafA/YrhL